MLSEERRDSPPLRAARECLQRRLRLPTPRVRRRRHQLRAGLPPLCAQATPVQCRFNCTLQRQLGIRLA